MAMTKEEFWEFHKDFTDNMLRISKKKGHDYTGGNSDPFANFTAVEKLGICSTELGFLTRMQDKIMRLSTFANQGKLVVENESFEDACSDIANYAILLAGYIKSKPQNKEGAPNDRSSVSK